jgi:hypothetical protein
MTRFAVSITAVEILLTAFAAALFTLESEPEPYFSEDDLRELSLPFEKHQTQRRIRFDALLGYDSSFTLQRPAQNAWVSVRVDQTRDDYASRRRREESWATRPGFGSSTIRDDPGHQDQGYVVRHRSTSDVRCELVRFRGDRMLVVKVSRGGLGENHDEELAACERRARLLQARMLGKIRWWSETGATADPR